MDIPQSLLDLHVVFGAADRDVRLAGGGVRDRMLGREAKDDDLATDARPTEIPGIAAQGGWKVIPTGAAHGTFTLVPPGGGAGVEVTSLRHEPPGHAREAIPVFTSDWQGDAARRDLTINAMMMDHQGRVHDWFGGREDLAARRLKFVGVAEERIQEDPLRMLRFVRMAGKFPGLDPVIVDPASAEAIHGSVNQLRQVSVERVWTEVKGILNQPASLRLLTDFPDLVHRSGLPDISQDRGQRVLAQGGNALEVLATGMTDKNDVFIAASRWKISASERNQLLFMVPAAQELHGQPPQMQAQRIQDHLADGVDRSWIRGVARMVDAAPQAAEVIRPVFSLKGQDLLEQGWSSGPAVGRALAGLRAEWKASRYTEEPRIPPPENRTR